MNVMQPGRHPQETRRGYLERRAEINRLIKEKLRGAVVWPAGPVPYRAPK